MNLSLIGRLAGAAVVSLGLAGCIDMTMDLKVTSETTAEATVTQTMAADIYEMIKSSGKDSGDAEFCSGEDESLTVNGDGTATCTATSAGRFDELKFDEGDSKPVFTAAGPGLVRVAIKTEGLVGDLGEDDDPQTVEMMKQLFEGHFLTMRFSGKEVTDTNMTLSPDHSAAEVKLSFVELMNGTAELPAEYYAVVRVK